jgi:hypothetical protein
MALPKLSAPRFSVELPSTGQRVSFRPFLVKEEKALLMAATSSDQNSMIDAVKDVLAACVLDDNVNVSNLPFFDLEYLFLNLRAKSVGEVVKLEYRHTGGMNYSGIECEAVTPVEINLERVKVERNEKHTNKIKITDNLGVVMRYPTISDIKLVSDGTDELKMIAKCIVSVYDEENVYEPDNLQDAVDFIDSLNTQQFAKIMEFIATMPKLKHTFRYKCKGCGQEDTVTLEGLSDFF